MTVEQFDQVRRGLPPNALLFLRVGDFYETYRDDAEFVANTCHLAITHHPLGATVCFPVGRDADMYLRQLLKTARPVTFVDPAACRERYGGKQE